MSLLPTQLIRVRILESQAARKEFLAKSLLRRGRPSFDRTGERTSRGACKLIRAPVTVEKEILPNTERNVGHIHMKGCHSQKPIYVMGI